MGFNVTVTPQVQEVEISATVQPYEVQVTANQDLVDYVDEARQYAEDADASASSASVSASSASNSAGVASSSASTATTQAGIATAQAGIATTKANEANQSASNALASEQSASQSASNALASEQASALSASNALASEQNALASEQSASQSEINALASEQASAQSEANALSSEQNALASEQASALSASNALSSANSATSSASTATTQAGIATTQANEASVSASNALASEQAATQSALESEAARDEIVSKINFTGAVEGDLFRVNSLGVAVRINETEFLKSKVPFLKSPLSGLVDLDNVFAWDSFNRAGVVVGNADSGQPWLNLTFNPFVIAGKSARASVNTGSIAVIERELPIPQSDPNRGGVGIFCNYFYRGNLSRIVVMKDVDNYFFYTIFLNSVILGKVIGGVLTTVLSQNVNRDTESHSYVDFKLQRNTGSQRLYLTVVDGCDGVQRRIDLTSDYANFAPEDWRYVGFFTTPGNIAQSVFYKNVIMYNL
jgi:hypothetical protein